MWKAPGSSSELCNKLLSSFAVKFKLRRWHTATPDMPRDEAAALLVGPARKCSQSHRVAFYSRNEGSKCATRSRVAFYKKRRFKMCYIPF